jgi:hypothetical protein
VVGAWHAPLQLFSQVFTEPITILLKTAPGAGGADTGEWAGIQAARPILVEITTDYLLRLSN